MNILQFNVRLAEGGAAGVALDLHQRALQQGLASHFVYGSCWCRLSTPF
ncbi:hypothetical protein JT622_004066 [Escherichia coli]|nr:hypothetical protein [Escherichia coli]